MIKKLLTVVVIGLFLTSAFLTTSALNIKKESMGFRPYYIPLADIYVDDDNTLGPWDGTIDHPYQFIQNGIDAADNEDVIFVFNGTYIEQINVTKSVKIVGENKINTIIDGNYSQIVINIISDNVELKSFTIKNSNGYTDNAGIKVESNNVTIDNCIIYRTKIGIYIFKSIKNFVKNCIFHTNGNGVLIDSSTCNTINNCQFSNNGIGINVKKSRVTNIDSSYVHTCGIGIYFEESYLINILQSAICDTNDNGAGVFVLRCKDINILNSNIYHNGNGIELDASSSVLIRECDIINNTHQGAIKFENCKDDILIRDSLFFNNFQFAIRLINSSIVIKNNNFLKNKLFAVYSESSKFDARFNWWGFFTGPSFFSFGLSDRIKRFPFKIRYFPWKLFAICGIGSDWDTNDKFEKIALPDDLHFQIEIEGIDTDDDGCPDWWEEKWGYDPESKDNHSQLDPDYDALNNIEECFTDKWGSNPFYKDVFLEIDCINSSNPEITNKPSTELLEKMKSRFKENNINLHIDTGNFGCGEEIPYKEFLTHSDICNYYWDYFLHNDLNNPRKGIFHYILITNYNQDESQVAMGWDHIDYAIVDAQGQCERHPSYSRERLVTYASMHELGHTFELFTEKNFAIDNVCAAIPLYREFWKYSRYKSCMNYRYVYSILDYSDGSRGKNDFDDWGNLNFSYFKNTVINYP